MMRHRASEGVLVNTAYEKRNKEMFQCTLIRNISSLIGDSAHSHKRTKGDVEQLTRHRIFIRNADRRKVISSRRLRAGVMSL